jgi:hypothetical protein
MDLTTAQTEVLAYLEARQAAAVPFEGKFTWATDFIRYPALAERWLLNRHNEEED